jgi:hypothetical protein
MRNARNIDKTQAFGGFDLAGSCQLERERVRNLPIKWHTADTVSSVDVLACSARPDRYEPSVMFWLRAGVGHVGQRSAAAMSRDALPQRVRVSL